MPSFLFFVMLLSFNLSCHGSEGANKLRRQHILQSNDGEYDCVDIYEQPAFDNILLKNHKIQMNPSSLPKIKGAKIHSNSSFGVQDKSCPRGMVPIPRTKVGGDYEIIHPLSSTAPGRHFAVYNVNGVNAISSITARLSVHNPPVQMDQVSMSHIRVESGPPAELNFIQVGWAVHPRLYGDNLTRLTAYWTADNSIKTGCYNYACPGFVQVHPKTALGDFYDGTSDPPALILSTQYLLFRDHATGNWWLTVENNIILGYFPKELFTHLSEGASVAQYGGWTYNSPDGLSPPMGSGRFPSGLYTDTSYFYRMQVLDEFNNVFPFDKSSLQKVADNTSCYNAMYLGFREPDVGYVLSYGGPGGMCGI